MFITEIGILDILISSIYVTILFAVLFIVRPKNPVGYKKYFIPFIITKVVAAIGFVLLHVYVYKGGDTFVYFQGGKYFAKELIESPLVGIRLLGQGNESLVNFPYDPLFNIFYFFRAGDIFFMSKLISVLCLLSFNQFLTATILFSLISAIGIWKLYQTLSLLYPSLYKYFAFGTLFYPTVAIWGSGILKDPLALASVGFIVYAFHMIFQKKRFLVIVIYLLIGVIFCLKLKPYLLYILIPTMLLWGQSRISKQIKNRLLKALISPLILLVFIGGGFLFLNTVSESAGKYSLENVQGVAEGFQSWHSLLAEERDQSGYSLGNVEFTPIGILLKLPESLIVTYYRPFIVGDIRNSATAFEAIQSLILLILSLYVLFKVGLLKFFRIAFQDHNVRAFLFFAVVFGTAVGLTSYNFGALSRYKIPCLPFFTASLAIIYYHGYLKKKTKSRIQA